MSHDSDPVACPVEEGSASLQCCSETRIDGTCAVADEGTGLGADPVAVETVRQGHLRESSHGDAVFARSAHGHLVHHTAGRADAPQGVGAVDDLDTVDEERIDGVAIAGAVAHGRRLRDAVDRVQRRATAQALS